MNIIKHNNHIKHFNTIKEIIHSLIIENERSFFFKIDRCTKIATNLKNYTKTIKWDEFENRDEFYTVNIDNIKLISSDIFEMYISIRYRNISDEKNKADWDWESLSNEIKVKKLIDKGVKEEHTQEILDKLSREEIENLDVIETSDPIRFSELITLTRDEMEHSWAGSELTNMQGELLSSETFNFNFGIDSSYKYYNNGNLTDDSHSFKEPNFNINETYSVLISTEIRNHYNNNHYDDLSYKYITYTSLINK